MEVDLVKNLRKRWIYLIAGAFALLCVGIVYAWSILKAPLANEFGWTPVQLSLNFTIVMASFCIGSLLGGVVRNKIGVKLTLLCSAIIASCGIGITAIISLSNILSLYIFYGLFGGIGIGIAYNTVLAALNAWFPDRKGLCSGILLMAFGTSTLVMGNIADKLFQNPKIGWRNTYLILAAVIFIVVFIASLIIKDKPDDLELPKAKEKKDVNLNIKTMSLTTLQLIKRPAFWIAFAVVFLLSCTGNSTASFAKDLMMSLGSSSNVAVLMAGIFSVCNGLGRIIGGAFFDKMGCKKGMWAACGITLLASTVTLISTIFESIPLCCIGMCLAGLSFGTCPIYGTNFVAVYYGMENFGTNFAIMNFTPLVTSVMATVSNLIYQSSGAFAWTFMFIVVLTIIATVLNKFIDQP